MAANAKAGIVVFLILIMGGLMKSPFATAASTNVQVHVCSEPTVALLTRPANDTHTTLSSTIISGKPTAGVRVQITNNGRAYPLATPPLSVLFTDRVPLQIGQNNIVITTANACSQTRVVSFNVYRSAPSASIVWGVLCIIELLIIILLIVLLLACKRHKQQGEGEHDLPSTP
jgi:hypothetical protein